MKHRNGSFTSAPIGRTMISTAISMLPGTLAISGYNIADTYFVGQLHNTVALAAMGYTFPVIMIIGCIFRGKKDSKDKTYYLYNVCDHQECYKEVGSQAISYTTGVPAMIGAMLVMNGTWTKPGVYNIEEFDPDPFMDALNKWGLPWKEDFDPVLVD